MKTKKLILVVFILFTLNFTAVPVNYLYLKKITPIVYNLEVSKSRHIYKFFNLNERVKIYEGMTLKIRIISINKSNISFYNSS